MSFRCSVTSDVLEFCPRPARNRPVRVNEPGARTVDDVVELVHTTVEGGTVTVTGSGDDLKVNDAGVICGGVQTANATVYLIDSVLMPQ